VTSKGVISRGNDKAVKHAITPDLIKTELLLGFSDQDSSLPNLDKPTPSPLIEEGRLAQSELFDVGIDATINLEDVFNPVKIHDIDHEKIKANPDATAKGIIDLILYYGQATNQGYYVFSPNSFLRDVNELFQDIFGDPNFYIGNTSLGGPLGSNLARPGMVEKGIIQDGDYASLYIATNYPNPQSLNPHHFRVHIEGHTDTDDTPLRHSSEIIPILSYLISHASPPMEDADFPEITNIPTVEDEDVLPVEEASISESENLVADPYTFRIRYPTQSKAKIAKKRLASDNTLLRATRQRQNKLNELPRSKILSEYSLKNKDTSHEDKYAQLLNLSNKTEDTVVAESTDDLVPILDDAETTGDLEIQPPKPIFEPIVFAQRNSNTKAISKKHKGIKNKKEVKLY